MLLDASTTGSFSSLGERLFFKKDVDSIPLSVDFRKYLDEWVAKCEVFLVVIGRDWVKKLGNKGKSRLDDPTDFVRMEVESALKRQMLVIAVLVNGASLPASDLLPESIWDLSYRHGILVRPDTDFYRDMDRLIKALKEPTRGLKVDCQESDAVPIETTHLSRQNGSRPSPFRDRMA